MAKHVVAAVAEFPPGTRKLAQLNGRAIVVFNLGGEFFALNNRCPHRGGSLAPRHPDRARRIEGARAVLLLASRARW